MIIYKTGALIWICQPVISMHFSCFQNNIFISSAPTICFERLLLLFFFIYFQNIFNCIEELTQSLIHFDSFVGCFIFVSLCVFFRFILFLCAIFHTNIQTYILSDIWSEEFLCTALKKMPLCPYVDSNDGGKKECAK